MGYKEVLNLLRSNTDDVFAETCRILIKIADNIMKDPQNQKYRTLMKNNTLIFSKVLSVDGGKESLAYMGFNENQDSYVLQPSAPLRKLEELKNCLSAYKSTPAVVSASSKEIRTRFNNLSKYVDFKLLNPIQLLEKPVSLTPLYEQSPHFLENNIEEISGEVREISSLPTDIKKKLNELEPTEFWFEIYSSKNSAEERVFKIYGYLFSIYFRCRKCIDIENLFTTEFD